jgi:hypothetical protein
VTTETLLAKYEAAFTSPAAQRDSSAATISEPCSRSSVRGSSLASHIAALFCRPLSACAAACSAVACAAAAAVVELLLLLVLLLLRAVKVVMTCVLSATAVSLSARAASLLFSAALSC